MEMAILLRNYEMIESISAGNNNIVYSFALDQALIELIGLKNQ